MCTTDYYPSFYPQGLRGLKLSKFRNFHYFKNELNPIYFDTAILRQLLDPSGHLQRAKSHPFKTALYYFFYLYLALPFSIEFHLPNTFALNTCAAVIMTTSGLSVSGMACRIVFSCYGRHTEDGIHCRNM